MSSDHLLNEKVVFFENEKVVNGSGGDSDIVLSDSMVEPHHAEITFSESGTVAKPMDGQVFVDGKLIKEES
jgi:pSer/pThr/pTyr-binding forkhead associated (FHA) protein